MDTLWSAMISATGYFDTLSTTMAYTAAYLALSAAHCGTALAHSRTVDGHRDLLIASAYAALASLSMLGGPTH